MTFHDLLAVALGTVSGEGTVTRHTYALKGPTPRCPVCGATMPTGDGSHEIHIDRESVMFVCKHGSGGWRGYRWLTT